MTSLTIRDIEPEMKDALRRVAAAHGRSIQDEARSILRAALKPPPPASEQSLYAQIRAIVEPIGGIDLELPPRDTGWEPPSFD